MMLGAMQAAERWSRQQQQKDRAKGRKEGRAEERKALIAAFRARANGNADLHRIIDEVESERR